MMKLASFPFSKYSGAGNDFILIDNREGFFSSEDDILIRSLCHRQQGIGADGLILLETSNQADARYRIFNADGHEADMCGNGLRCFVRFLQECGFEKKEFIIETKCGLHRAAIREELIEVELVASFKLEKPCSLEICMSSFSNTIVPCVPKTLFFSINTGVPHAVSFQDEISSIDVERFGEEVSSHPHFAPEKTNVNFCMRLQHQKLSLRTFERGVNQETLACGTGAAAAALVAAHLWNWESPIEIVTRSEEVLTISFSPDWSYVGLTGPAKKIFKGTFSSTH